jgi:anti-sigma regulatory factor (Ser/Thr protein kinase)
VGFELVLGADPAALSLIRDRLRRWLAAQGWPDAEREDLLLAVSEAASNAAEHAYPPGVHGTIEIDGRITEISDGARMVELTVRDRGRWRPIPELPENRRRGIPLMRAVVADLVIEGTDQGTCVMMRGWPIGR